jgi:glycerol-1-phosphate dehydrogenase [NAD(P)+]
MWEKYSHVIPFISVGAGVINTVADWVSSQGYNTLLVVNDPNTRRVAGEHVITALKAEGLTVQECIFRLDEPLPDEYAIGFVTASVTPDVELILGVGSGTINDICTYVGARVSRPAAIVATAPSMDGYASLGSAMLLDGLKVTPPTICPVAIFCDTDILSAAPKTMIAAGLGDMLGKITAHADWLLSFILTGEAMPKDVKGIVETALDKVIAGAPYIAERDPTAIQSITEGLILSGIAMSLYGDSRPASGMEHHLAHFWEMRMIIQGKKPALHGIKVGLATIASLVIWNELAAIGDIEELPLRSPQEASTHTDNIQRLYGRSADAILKTKNPNLPIEHIKANWQKIIGIARSLPKAEEIAAKLSGAGAPIRPSEINLDSDTLRDSLIYARDRKKTYTLLQLLGDLGCLEHFASRVGLYFERYALSGVKCFVLDMDGTIYLGSKIFPFTIAFLKHLKETGKDFIFYTNNSSQNAEFYINKLQRMGISIEPEKLLMSTHVLLTYLKEKQENNPESTQKKHVFISGTEALKADFTEAGYTLTDDSPDFTVLGFDTDMDYGRLTKLCGFVRSGLPVYGVNMDYNCPVEGGFIPDCGALASALTTSTGVTPEFFGKPSRRTLDYIINKTGYREEELCFIGDRLYTDIAITSGTRSRSVLVLSGETKRDDLNGSVFVPDLVVDNLEQLQPMIV